MDKEFLRHCQLAYYARFPEKSTSFLNSIDIANIEEIERITTGDIKFVEGFIANMGLTAQKNIPGWSYIATAIRNEYIKKQGDKNNGVDLIEMCALSPESLMYINITQAMIEDILPADELPIRNISDRNILKVIEALYEDGRITERMRDYGILGFNILNGGDIDGISIKKQS